MNDYVEYLKEVLGKFGPSKTRWMVGGQDLVLPQFSLFPCPTPAVRLCGRTVLISWRALFEPCELARPFYFLRSTNLIWPNWASMVLTTLAETKVVRLPGRTPAF